MMQCLPDFLTAIALSGMNAPDERWTTIGTGDVPLAERLVIKRSPESCIYIHRWLRSDPDELHDHPWDWCSLILSVGYFEVTPEGRTWREPGSVAFRKAEERHRVEVAPGTRPVSLFITGVERREWGFHLDNGEWVVGREYRAR